MGAVESSADAGQEEFAPGLVDRQAALVPDEDLDPLLAELGVAREANAHNAEAILPPT